MTFALRINELLKANGITAYRLAQDTNTGERLIGYWKKGEKSPSMENLIKLADYFNVSIDYLVGRDDVPNRKDYHE